MGGDNRSLSPPPDPAEIVLSEFGGINNGDGDAFDELEAAFGPFLRSRGDALRDDVRGPVPGDIEAASRRGRSGHRCGAGCGNGINVELGVPSRRRGCGDREAAAI